MMSVFKEYTEYDAIGLSRLVAQREVSLREVVDAAFARIELVNPQLNAIVHTLYDEAVEQARLLDQSARGTGLGLQILRGVPIAVKDCVAGMRGIPQRFGTRLTRSHIPNRDEKIIKRYREAGVIFIGQTNAPEFSSSLTTEPVLYGPCRNPWNPLRTVGGSSGGSACAVAAGMVPVATANDSAGSIRIPASCTGIFGLKPSCGRTPNGPDVSEIWNGLFVQHVVSRTVRDSAAFLDAAHGLDPGPPYAAPHFNGTYLQQASTGSDKLRIGVSIEPLNGVPVAQAYSDAIRQAVVILEDLGHDVIEAAPSLEFESFFGILEDMLCANLAYEIRNHAKDQGVEIGPEPLEACNRAIMELGETVSATRFLKFFDLKARCERALGRFFGEYDAFLTPTLAMEPVEHGFINAESPDLRAYLDRFWEFSPYTALANICGIPSMSVPIHRSGSGLPIGIQISMAYGCDDKLFRLAGDLEAVCEWSSQTPDLTS
tara:strand:- start:2244 stop:3704 length:1461 start_codon:yes stop_codon:yes gene_type:complete